MIDSNIKRTLISIYIIFLLITAGFIGILIFEGVLEKGGVEAASILYVGGSGPGNYTTIQAAINAAKSGDTIRVYAGTYNENVIVNKTVTLIGNGTAITTINGGASDDVVFISADWVNITGFKITNSGTNSEDAGIDIGLANNCKIENCNFPNNERGIRLNFSSNNIIRNNTCNSNRWGEGIELSDSPSNTIENNTCSNNWEGIKISSSSSNTIKNNTCSNNYDGIDLWFSTNNIFYNNTMSSCGLSITAFSKAQWNSHIIGIDNTVNGNPIYYWKNRNGGTVPSGAGQIILANCNNVRVENQNINGGSDGILLGFSYNNIISKNTCNSHKWNGINLDDSSNNIIENNICSNNFYGMDLFSSSSNKIRNNTFSNNEIGGLSIAFSSENTIINNTFSNSWEGLELSYSSNHYIYHNNFISNHQHVDDYGGNRWNNDLNEGNYWDDYNGLDNGENDRQTGDGIGDTDVPHLDIDNYPIMKPSGWLFPNAPIIQDSANIDPDGNFTISWNRTCGATGYILEEDKKETFDSPIVVYNGPGKSFKIRNRNEGTYYYHVKAYNENHNSGWSDTVEMIVNQLPPTPQNLKVSVYPDGNALNLSWDANMHDTVEYVLYYKTEGDWEYLDTILYPLCSYNHTNLQNGKEYYYQIQAKDAHEQLSKFSNVVYAVPEDTQSPAPPSGIVIKALFTDSISLVWKATSEVDLEGYNIYRSRISTPKKWGRPIATQLKNTVNYIDSDLNEFTTYYYVITAFDEIPNESNYSEVAVATTLLGSYGPEINNSISNFKITEDNYDNTTINLYHWFKDINNDELMFWCEGYKNINVKIYQENGTVVLKPKLNWNGKEKLTFYASDGIYEIFDNVSITITPVNDPPGQPEITSPKNGIEIEDGTTINFKGTCDDPDMPYGDKLTFIWISNISGEIGNGKNLENIILSIGNHRIILEVTDENGETSKATLNITVLETPNSDSDSDGIPNVWERAQGLDPFNKIDAENDPDNDGLSNLAEYKFNTKPQDPDTDGDGYNDKLDKYPLDPLKWDDTSDKGKEEKDFNWIWIVGIIIVVIILLLFLFLIKSKKLVHLKKEIEEEPKLPIGKARDYKPGEQRFCSICNKSLTFIEQYNRYYCHNCGKYV